MAEHVQAALDQMVAPLNDLKCRNVFSAEEIHAIVQRRRQSEYDLRRRHARKADYLRYLQAEMDLEKLRKLRMKRLQRESKRRNFQQEQSKHIGDKHILQHIHLLWVRTLRKFRDDVALYLEYAEFCKESKSWKRLGRLYAEALQLHPKETGLWIEAASHEFFQAGSLQNARVILQRGLRCNPKSQDLWLQSFALELHFLQKLRGRRAVLLGKDKVGVKKEETETNHKIATIVYDNAIAAIPDNVAFRLQFLDQCRLFPDTHDLQTHILGTMERDCEQEPEAWIARAMYQWEKSADQCEEVKGFMRSSDNDGSDEEEDEEPSKKRRRQERGEDDSGSEEKADGVLRVLKEAIKKLPREDMYLQAIRFVQSYVQQVDEEDTELLVACRSFLEDSFARASESSFYSSGLALEQADYLVLTDRKDQAATCLGSFVDKKEGTVDATVYRRWAYLASSNEAAVSILRRALKHISMNKPDHMVILLELLGARIAEGASDHELSDLFQRILLLSPGLQNFGGIDEPAFGIKNVADACLQYLEHEVETKGWKAARKVCNAVLFQSSFAESLDGKDIMAMKSFLDESLQAERNCHSKKERNKRLRRLYDVAIKLFDETEFADEYRQRRDEDILGIKAVPREVLAVPQFNVTSDNFDPQAFAEAFAKFRLVHLINVKTDFRTEKSITWKDIGGLFARLNSSDQNSWCIETLGGPATSSNNFLRPQLTSDRAYCSFLVQKDKPTYQWTLQRLPVRELAWTDWSYETALWVFFGRNRRGNEDLGGRPEHTDSISHDGTWHYQLSGKKQWFLRPTRKLMRQMRENLSTGEMELWNDSTRVRVTCNAGDVIVVDTSLWFHRTVIPPQDEPSVSYARDFRGGGTTTSEGSGGMTNLDGLYATGDIEANTVIFTEKDMPDCELHRSSVDPNCEVVELEDGTSAVVSSREIAAGEFFCVADSSDEEHEDLSSLDEQTESD